MRRFWIFIGIGLGAIVLVIAGALLVFYTMDWNTFRDDVAARAGTALDREVEIRGDLRVAPSLTPQILVEDVVFANAEWGSRPEMVRVRELYVEFKIWPLLLGRLEINQIHLVGSDILLEASGDRRNWRFGADTGSAEREEFPVIRRMTVEDSRLVFKSTELEQPIELRFDRIDVRAGSIDDAVRLDIEGVYRQSPFDLEADLGSFARLRDPSEPFPVELRMTVGDTKAAFEGKVQAPLDLKGIKGKLAVEGKNLAELHRILNLPLPQSPAYRLTAELDHSGEEWRLIGFSGKLGTSDFSGDVAVMLGGQRPKITADVASKSITLSDIEGFWAAKEPPAAEAGGTFIPNRPFALLKLRAMDAEVRFEGKSIKSSSPLLDRLAATVELDNGLLTLKPLDLGLAGGRVAGNLRLNGRSDVPEVAADLRIRRIQLPKLLQVLGVTAESVGELRGHAKIESRGISLHRIAANMDGEMLLVMEGGRLSNLLLELVALDFQEAVGQWVSGDRSLVRIDCFLAPSRIDSGIIIAAPWILDTSDALVTIEGAIDLDTEAVNFELEPHPKDFSLFNTLTSITIEGDLAKRTASVDELDAAAKLVLKAIMAPLMPLLSSEIEKKARSDRPCSQLIRRARQAGE